MLRRLKVRNLAVVESAEAEFAPGLNVITGETGAGKSVLMGALGLVLGGRADASSVRDGAKEAEVEADFDGRTFRRTVTREGRSRAWIDDESVSIAELREAAAALVDVHGPTAALRLADEAVQRDALDAFAAGSSGAAQKAHAAALANYAEKWGAFAAADRALAEMVSDAAAAGEDAADLLRYQVGELEAAGLTEEDETLAERHAAAAHAGEIVSCANEITEALGGDEGAAAILSALQPRFRAAARHLPQAAEWAEEAEEVTLRIQELSRTVADAAAGLAEAGDSLDELDARLTVVNRLRRKYLARGADAADGAVSALLALLDEKRARLDAIEHREERLAALRGEREAALAAAKVAGAVLTKARAAAAKRMAPAVVAELRHLGFLKADFSVSLEPCAPAEHGCDRVVFMFGPNPGEAPRPLAAIASSGEIARVALALLAVAPSGGAGPTLVFDEIDANIGGEVAKAVGERLKAVARGGQVVAITHLPQTAVCGDRHLVVSKSVSGGRTRASVGAVDGAARVSEVARMLGGEKITSVARKHAEELLGISS